MKVQTLLSATRETGYPKKPSELFKLVVYKEIQFNFPMFFLSIREIPQTPPPSQNGKGGR